MGNDIGPQVLKCLKAAEDKNKAGVLVLTVWRSREGSALCKVHCTNLSGVEMEDIEVEPQSTIASLHKAIASQCRHEGHLRLIFPDGTLLSDMTISVGELLDKSNSPTI